jgi:hypothetical protein
MPRSTYNTYRPPPSIVREAVKALIVAPGLGGRQVAAGRVQDQPAMGDSGGNRRRGFPQSCP